MSAKPVIDIHQLTKRFASPGGEYTEALAGIDLHVREGEFVGILGPNGAGKTTLLQLILGLRRPDSGSIRLFGGNPVDPVTRTRIGSTPQQTALPETLRVSEALRLVAAHYPNRADIGRTIADFGLEPLLRKQCGALSGGQQRRVSVALAFIGNPDLVVLDEPTVGLDVAGRADLWRSLRERNAAGCAILVTSHYLEEIEALAERVVVLNSGRILADEPISRVLARIRKRWISLRGVTVQQLATLPGEFELISSSGEQVHGVTVDADAFIRALVREQLPFRDLLVRGASLEEAFLAITRQGGEHDAEVAA